MYEYVVTQRKNETGSINSWKVSAFASTRMLVERVQSEYVIVNITGRISF